MTPFRDLSIGKKLTRLAVLASALALVAASLAFMVFDLLAMRSTLLRRLTTAADIVGYNGVAALLFQDRKAATATLAALRAEPHVLGAAIYSHDGRLFARYRRADGGAGFVPPPALGSLEPGARFHGGRLELLRAIDFEGSPGGSVLIVSDLSEITNRLVRYAVLVLAVSFAALGIAAAMSVRFQRAVSEPILALARTARTVSQAKDYSVRASPAGRDEIGLLVDTFNEMLAQIQRRDAEVTDARASLERRVEERTRDLRHELTERLRMEAARAEAEAAERRAAFLARVSSVLASSLETARTVAAATSLSVPEFADWCVLDMVSDGTLARREISHADPARAVLIPDLKERQIGRDSDAPAARVLRTGRVEVFPAERALERSDRAHVELVEALGAGTMLAAPLLVQGEALGAMVWCRLGRGFQPADVLVGEEVARRAAVSIEHAQLFQAAQHANRLKDEFLATLSHELRTPLHAIVGWAHMLRTGRLDPATAKKAIETIDRNAQAQNQLISDILDVSRIVAGKVRLHLEPLDLARVALAAVDTVRPAAEAKDVRLVTDLPPEAGPVSGDADRLQQVVWNLLSNAIKFVPKGGRVEVRLAENDGGVDLTIADDGPGIKPEFLPYVFERFRQADSSSTRPHGGLGIGLAIVRHLVELHGGTVAARNRDDGTGAVFTVSLPRRAPAAPAFPAGGPRTADAWLEAAPSLEGLVVLVVDDEADARDMLSNVLALAGAHVREAASARDALTLMEKEAPDVLLSDIEMPERDGYTLIEEVRILSPERGGRVPAAAITAYASAEDRSRALASGFDAHVAKPVEPAELVRVVAALAGRTAKAAESPAATHSGAPTILIVEDDPDSAESLALLLEELGYEVTTAGDAKEALRQIERGAPRLALVDISLPGMSGLELAETIRRRAGPERTALVAMSGYGREEDIERSRAAGFTHHLVKPMDPVALGELLARLLAAEPARLS